MSPSQDMAPFQPSPCHSALGGDYDLASPVALPETPEAVQGSSRTWAANPDHRYQEDEETRDELTSVAPIAVKSGKLPIQIVDGDARRSSMGRQSIAKLAPTPVPEQRKRKVKHGGIYSLLLKSRPGDKEPVLVGEEVSPEVPEGKGRLIVYYLGSEEFTFYCLRISRTSSLYSKGKELSWVFFTIQW